jgi:hypothetical protein
MHESVARAMWQVFEPIHAVTYFAPEARKATDAAGAKGGWMGYFGSRAAPMGPVSAEVVIATFFNFHPPGHGASVDPRSVETLDPSQAP